MFKIDKYEKALAILFLLTLPLVNPWVRGDGVGYYAFDRALLIDHNLDFRKDWIEANPSFRMGRTDERGNILPAQFTQTGHLNNHFSIGPAILWAPFLITAHVVAETGRSFGAHVAADGFSSPYRLAMAFGTAFYGFLGLLFSFRLSRKYVPESWAFLATLAIWFASSLAVYMYFNPSWSHAQSAFTVALYLWYWDRTRADRNLRQWLILGLLAALMMNVYYVNGVLLIIPLIESIGDYQNDLRSRQWRGMMRLLIKNFVFTLTLFVGFIPTLVTKKVIYGGYFNFGYTENWFWNSPALLKVGFSSDHGLFSWTPLLFLAVIGLFFLHRHDRAFSLYLVVAFLIYLYVIGCYESWDGISSFGNRFFVSLTPIFVIGLAALLDALESAWNQRSAKIVARCSVAVFILWNLGLVFQWGTHLMPARGSISWRATIRNQFLVVPVRIGQEVEVYMTQRKKLMENIEKGDVEQSTSGPKTGQGDVSR